MKRFLMIIIATAALVACGDPEDLGDTGDTDNGVHPGDDDDDDIEPPRPGDPIVDAGGVYLNQRTGEVRFYTSIIGWSGDAWISGFGFGGQNDWCADYKALQYNGYADMSGSYYVTTIPNYGDGHVVRFTARRSGACGQAGPQWWAYLERAVNEGNPFVWRNDPTQGQEDGYSLCGIWQNGLFEPHDGATCNNT